MSERLQRRVHLCLNHERLADVSRQEELSQGLRDSATGWAGAWVPHWLLNIDRLSRPPAVRHFIASFNSSLMCSRLHTFAGRGQACAEQTFAGRFFSRKGCRAPRWHSASPARPRIFRTEGSTILTNTVITRLWSTLGSNQDVG